MNQGMSVGYTLGEHGACHLEEAGNVRAKHQVVRVAEFGGGGEHDEVLEMYKMFAYDEGWSRRINEAIDSGLTAEAAIERVQQRTRMRMRQIDDPLLRDRMHDLEDLSNRLLRIVSGKMGTAATQGLRPCATTLGSTPQ